MSGDNFSASSHLSVVVTTAANDEVLTTGGTVITSSSSLGADFYFQCAVVVIGVVGAVTNALVLYAMVVSNQHRKQFLIFNQNIFDLCSSILLIVIYILKLCNIYLTGTLGYWLCMIIFSENLLWTSLNGSHINLVSITVERYLKVVHHSWSKKVLRKWLKISAAAFAWISGIVYNMALVFSTSAVVDGVCYGYVFFKSRVAGVAHGIWNFISFYVLVMFIFIFCYGRILVVIRRQASIMAGHGGPGSSTTTQTQAQQIQSNVIKTMILVTAFYVIMWVPNAIYYFILNVNSSLTLLESGHYIVVFLAFLYTSANPFIYAVKFDPVKRVLVGLIPWKNSSPSTTGSV